MSETLRQAAQQALEALDTAYMNDPDRADGYYERRMEALRAALAERPEKEQLTDEDLDVADMDASQVANQNLERTMASWRKAYLRAFTRAIEAAYERKNGIGEPK